MRENYSDLERATRVTAGLFAGPECIEATALLLEVGTRLGYRLEARAVSVFATNGTPHGNVATGVQGRAYGENFLMRRGRRVELGGAIAGGEPFHREAGHMVVVSAEHSLLLDPTFAQFSSLGPQAVSMMAADVPMRANRYWQVNGENLHVRYFAADDFGYSDFDKVRAASVVQAEKIIGHIRSTE